MKRFLLFAGSDYYPSGGWGDFNSDHDTALEAVLAAAELEDGTDWWQVIDTQTKSVVHTGHRK